MDLIIETERGQLQLAKNQNFWITKQLHDLTSLQDRQGDFTRLLTIPATLENLNILEVTDSANQPGLSTNVSINGILIINGGSLFYDNVTKESIDIDIMIDNTELFTLIRRPLSDLDLSAFDFSITSVGGLFPKTAGAVYARADWFDEETSIAYADGNTIKEWDGANDTNVSGFFFYAKTLIEEIISQAGFNLTQDIDDSNFDTVAVVCPVPDFLRLAQPDIFANVDRVGEGAQTIDNATENVEFVVDTDTGGLWSLANDEYTIASGKDITIELIISGEYLFDVPGEENRPKIRVIAGTTILVEFEPGEVFNDHKETINYSTESSVAIFVEVFTEGSVIIGDASFMVVTQNTTPSTAITVSERMPDMEQGAFLRNIMKMFNLVIKTDSTNNQVTLFSFDNVYINEEQDLSELLLDNFTQLDSNEAPYFKRNLFSYSDGDSDANIEVLLSDNRLEDLGDVVSVEFISGRLSELFTERTARLNAYGADIVDNDTSITATSTTNGFTLSQAENIRVGDFLSTITETKRIATVTGTTTGTINGVWAVSYTTQKVRISKLKDLKIGPTIVNILSTSLTVNVTNGNLRATGQQMNDFRAIMDNAVKFSGLVNANYDKLFTSLDDFLMIQVSFRLDALQFASLDLSRPVFLEQYNALFFISVIEQWQPDQPTRAQLFRL